MSSRQSEFIIRPNGSFHSRTWIWLVTLLAFIALGIALRFAILGYWLILPFALLDVLAVGTVFFLVARHSAYVERVVMSENRVEIFHIQDNADAKWEFPLHWTQIRLEHPRYRGYPARLLLGCKGKWVEIGHCLTDRERGALTQALEREFRRFSAHPGVGLPEGRFAD